MVQVAREFSRGFSRISCITYNEMFDVVYGHTSSIPGHCARDTISDVMKSPKRWTPLVRARTFPPPNITKVESKQGKFIKACSMVTHYCLKNKLIRNDIVKSIAFFVKKEKVNWYEVRPIQLLYALAKDLSTDITNNAPKSYLYTIIQLNKSVIFASPAEVFCKTSRLPHIFVCHSITRTLYRFYACSRNRHFQVVQPSRAWSLKSSRYGPELHASTTR
ncbi:hypothetical protein [Azospirillum largimobile]